MDYFALSTGPGGFYDRTSNNEILRMQGFQAPALFEKLKEMTGVEYVLVESNEPTLFIIRKQSRESSSLTTALDLFYILNGVIYKAPDLLSICTSRLRKMIYHFQNALQQVEKEVRFDPARGYFWSYDAPVLEAAVQTKKAVIEPERTREQKWVIDRALVSLFEKFPVAGQQIATLPPPPPSLAEPPAQPPPTPLSPKPAAVAPSPLPLPSHVQPKPSPLSAPAGPPLKLPPVPAAPAPSAPSRSRKRKDSTSTSTDGTDKKKRRKKSTDKEPV
jgi:mediator of RNA polymerase II transcription subunit 6